MAASVHRIFDSAPEVRLPADDALAAMAADAGAGDGGGGGLFD